MRENWDASLLGWIPRDRMAQPWENYQTAFWKHTLSTDHLIKQSTETRQSMTRNTDLPPTRVEKLPGQRVTKGNAESAHYRPTKGRWKMLWSIKNLLVPGHISKGTELWPLPWRYRYFRSIWKVVSYTAQNFLPQFSQGEYLLSEFKENLHGFKKISRHERMSKPNLSPSRLRRNCGAEVGAQW